MVLTLSPGTMNLVRTANDRILLGIILADGTVTLAAADARAMPGHADWVRRDGITNAYRGLSVFVRAGEVASMMRSSTLNPPANGYALEPDLVRQLEAVLPLATSYVCYDD